MKQNWIERLTDEQLQESYALWSEDRREMGEEPWPFDEWLEMERELAHHSE